MFAARHFADLLTGLRALIALSLPIIGFSRGASALPLVVYLVLIGWISDYFDGVIARRGDAIGESALGKRDLEIDVLVSLGLLIYLTLASFLPFIIALFYVLGGVTLLVRGSFDKTSGSLLQAPIYLYFLWLGTREAPQAAMWVLYWVVLNLSFTWRRFLYGVIPEFLGGFRDLLRRRGN